MGARVFSPLGVTLCLICCGCSGGPEGPPGQEHFLFAKTNLETLEYDNALKNLEQAIKAAGGGSFGRQCAFLRVALLTAMAEGSKGMAEAYRAGAREPAASARQSQFLRMRSDYFGISRVRLLSAMEAVMGQRGKLDEQPVSLDIAFPDFAGTEPSAVTRIKNGQWVNDADRYRAELETVRNALARVLASLAGAGDDPHKGRATFQKGAQVDQRVYLIELSRTFVRLGGIFDRDALNDARYRRIGYEVVRDNIDAAFKLLEKTPDKDLEAQAKKIKADCEKALKALNIA